LAVCFVIDDVGVMAAVSFEKLFRAEYPRLVAFGFSATGSIEVARDLAQETLARAHRSWVTVQDCDVPEAWLRRVMKNLVVDHLRRQQVEIAAVGRLSSQRQRSEDVIGTDSRLPELLVGLPERQRLVVALVYGSDLSISEVADALGIAAGTVKATLWKARRSIQRRLLREVGDE
jgi:RNA polymerase sigma factor (sigma-70 family)